jgi:chemotaxis protein CheD
VWPETPVKDLFLNPGDYAFGEGQTRIRTILGSCVAVTFWHPSLRLGAMCHYLLPSRPGTNPEPPSGKYAEDVIQIIADHFRTKGLLPASIEVKMFGGSNMFPNLSLGEVLNIGTKNIHSGLASLTREGFNILTFDLAGAANRTVVFELWTGDVWVRQGRGVDKEPAKLPPDRRFTP